MYFEEDDILITQKQTDDYLKKFGLRRALSTLHLWGIGVGTVIAGTFFGWNYGLELSGSIGFLIATLIVSAFFIMLTYIFSNLSALFPYTGGPYAYARKGLGSFEGYLTGILTVIEFLFASAAVAVSIDSYISSIYPEMYSMRVALLCYLFFLLIEIIGVKQSAIVQLVMTGTAVIALILFMIGTSGSVNLAYIPQNQPFINGYNGIIQAIPFAFWFYLCIEGVSLSAEETINPQKNIVTGFRYSVLTVCLLNMIVLIICISTVDVSFLLSKNNPLSSVLEAVQPDDKVVYLVFTALAISSLLASLNGMINGYSRQVFALSRAGYLPKMLSRIHSTTKTPYWAIMIPGAIGIFLFYNLNAKELIFIAGIAALFMYIFVIHSYMKLKIKENRKLENSAHKTKRYLGLYVINISLFLIGAIAIIKTGFIPETIIFFIIAVMYYVFVGRKFIANDAPEEIEARDDKIKVK
jgi:Amino acid transporters